VVLRWFETLPEVDPGEDIDILVADEDLDAVGTLLTCPVIPPRRQKFDVYTVSGLPGSDFRGIPYYTADLAKALLANSRLLRGRYRVPSPQDHFDSLAYHAVYHKGRGSGLPATADSPPGGPGEHDYAVVLSRLAEELSLRVPITLAGLEGYLCEKGLRPPLDTLDKLSQGNEWLHEHVAAEFGPADAGIPGLAVFVLRERAAHLLPELCHELRREGWEPLESVHLSGDTAARVAAEVRGGTWGRGPWAVAGGGPVAFVVAYDLSTSVPGAALAYDRVTRSKLAIRRRLLAAMPGSQPFNPVHSSDNPRQAWDYLRLLDDPSIVARVEEGIERIRAAMVFPYPVVELLPSGRRRAVIAVVDHPEHGHSVCKLFYPGATRFLEREVRARTEFKGLPAVPELLESGTNYLLTPRYVDTGAHAGRKLPGARRVQLRPAAARTMAALTRELHERRVFLLDLTPQNLVSDTTAGLRVLDWEFLQDLPDGADDLFASPTVLGRAPDVPGVDTPLGVTSGAGSAVTVFHPTVTGVPARLLLAVPTLPGAVMAPGLALTFGARAVHSGARRARAGARVRLGRLKREVRIALERRAGAARTPAR
jgi:hypothetical protein